MGPVKWRNNVRKVSRCHKTGSSSKSKNNKKKEKLVVLPGDKGSTIVIKDDEDYRNKISIRLEDDAYRRIRYQTTGIKITITDVIKSSTTILHDKKEHLIVTDPRTPLRLVKNS